MLKPSNYGFEIFNFVEGNINMIQIWTQAQGSGSYAFSPVTCAKILERTVWCRKVLQCWAIAKRNWSQILISIKIEYLKLRKGQIFRQTTQLIQIYVKLLKVRKFVQITLQIISIWNVILSKLKNFKHLWILKSFNFHQSVEWKIDASEFQQLAQIFYYINLVLSKI